MTTDRRFGVAALFVVTLIGGLFLAAVPPTAARVLMLKGPRMQGALLIGKVDPGSRVRLDGRPVKVSKDGDFVLAFGRDAPPAAVLTVLYREGKRVTRRLHIARRTYDIQRIDGLPSRMVTPPRNAIRRILAEQRLIAATRRRVTDTPYFRAGFAWPVHGRVNGVFGSQRILNGKPRRPHYGVDVAAPRGTPVRAAADGVVALVHPGMYFTGKTVILDHGHGVTSVYIHMSAILVHPGARVRKGEIIGRVGRTGRTTGPHLHWGVYKGVMPVDPVLLTGPMPGAAATPTRSPRGALR